MFARKFSSDGRIRWPAPWRARKATRFPRSVPITYAPDGSPNGVDTLFSSRSVSSAMSYKPLPPMIPISIAIVSLLISRTLLAGSYRRCCFHHGLVILLPDVPGRDRRVVLEEHQRFALRRFLQEQLLRRERVH